MQAMHSSSQKELGERDFRGQQLKGAGPCNPAAKHFASARALGEALVVDLHAERRDTEKELHFVR